MTIHKTLIALALIAGMLMTSCNDYLDIKPKGDKIPETLTDYEALLRGETMLNPIAYMPVLQALYLMNDAQRNKMMLNTKNLTTANYMWDESADLTFMSLHTYRSLPSHIQLPYTHKK